LGRGGPENIELFFNVGEVFPIGSEQIVAGGEAKMAGEQGSEKQMPSDKVGIWRSPTLGMTPRGMERAKRNDTAGEISISLWKS
jgi:hypothetical protein